MKNSFIFQYQKALLLYIFAKVVNVWLFSKYLDSQVYFFIQFVVIYHFG